MSSVFVQLRAGEDEIRTVLGILLKNLGEGITSRTDVTQLGVLGGGTSERDDEAEEMDEMCQIPPETLTGYCLIFYTFFFGRRVSERFFLKSPNLMVKNKA